MSEKQRCEKCGTKWSADSLLPCPTCLSLMKTPRGNKDDYADYAKPLPLPPLTPRAQAVLERAMNYRIIERKGHYRVQKQRRFLWLKWWSTVGGYTPDGWHHTETFYSLEQAQKAKQDLEELDDRLRTPWKAIE